MASDEFISLDAPCEADAKDEGGDVQVKAPDVSGMEPLVSDLQPEGKAGAVGSNPKTSAGNLDLEEGQVEDMDLADDDVVVGKDQLLDASIQPEISVAAVQTVIGFEVKLDKGDGTENEIIYESNSISIEESRILLNGILCISSNILVQLQVSMFSEDSFVSIESLELYLHKKCRLLLILLGP
jgi:zinc finger CCHC domain-containing protein 8